MAEPLRRMERAFFERLALVLSLIHILLARDLTGIRNTPPQSQAPNADNAPDTAGYNRSDRDIPHRPARRCALTAQPSVQDIPERPLTKALE